MKLEAVESSNVEAIGYDSDTHELHVMFKGDGPRYVYEGVPVAAWEALRASESKGRHLNATVKNLYRFRREARESEES